MYGPAANVGGRQVNGAVWHILRRTAPFGDKQDTRQDRASSALRCSKTMPVRRRFGDKTLYIRQVSD